MYIFLFIVFILLLMFICKLVGYGIDCARDKAQKNVDMAQGKYNESEPENLADRYK